VVCAGKRKGPVRHRGLLLCLEQHLRYAALGNSAAAVGGKRGEDRGHPDTETAGTRIRQERPILRSSEACDERRFCCKPTACSDGYDEIKEAVWSARVQEHFEAGQG